MDKEIDEIIKNLNLARKEIGADSVKFYLNNETDYCFKFLKNEKVVMVIRRGVKRK